MLRFDVGRAQRQKHKITHSLLDFLIYVEHQFFNQTAYKKIGFLKI